MGNSFDVQHKVISIIKVFQPSVIGVGFVIKVFDVGFNVQQRRAVKDIQTRCDDFIVGDVFDAYDAQAQAIRSNR